MKRSKGFGLLGIIIIIIITAIISSIATGVIMLNNSKMDINDVDNDKELKEFIDVYKTLLSKYYNDIDKEGMLNAAEEAMLNFLDDKYTTYLNDSEYQDIIDDLKATYNGIGIGIENNVVMSVTEGSPAEKAGLRVGDIIKSIDNIDVTNMDSTEIGNIIKESKENSVNLLIIRDNETLNFTIEKKDLVNQAVETSIIENTSIGYLKISKFSENLDKQVKTSIESLENQGITSLIIDVRNNVGGYLSAAEDTSSLFLEQGKKIYSLQTNTNTFDYKDETSEKRSYPIVVLINNNTASAAEILAAALKESYNATLVGVKSYGKGKVQQVVPLENGDSVKYTSAKWLTPNGICIDGIGLNPDYYINEDSDQLNKAIEILTQ